MRDAGTHSLKPRQHIQLSHNPHWVCGASYLAFHFQKLCSKFLGRTCNGNQWLAVQWQAVQLEQYSGLLSEGLMCCVTSWVHVL